MTDGRFRIARKVAKDRVISTVDPDARHGHKTRAHGFDGYKGHVAIDPDSEVIVATGVSAGNTADGAAVAALLAEDLPAETTEMVADAEPLTVYGDSAYGTGALLDTFEQTGVIARCKTQPPRAPGGRFPKSEFGIDVDAGTVTCPAGHTVALRALKSGQIARFGALCVGCPLAVKCTGSRKGRTIQLGEHERQLAWARARQADRIGRRTTDRPDRRSSARSLT